MKATLLPQFSPSVSCGFPSPADDFIEDRLDINEHLIKHPSATYLVKAQGESMTGKGIFDGDTLIVDQHLQAKNGDIVIASINGEQTCKTLDLIKGQLTPANKSMPPIPIGKCELVIEGVVIHSIRHHVP